MRDEMRSPCPEELSWDFRLPHERHRPVDFVINEVNSAQVAEGSGFRSTERWLEWSDEIETMGKVKKFPVLQVETRSLTGSDKGKGRRMVVSDCARLGL